MTTLRIATFALLVSAACGTEPAMLSEDTAAAKVQHYVPEQVSFAWSPLNASTDEGVAVSIMAPRRGLKVSLKKFFVYSAINPDAPRILSVVIDLTAGDRSLPTASKIIVPLPKDFPREAPFIARARSFTGALIAASMVTAPDPEGPPAESQHPQALNRFFLTSTANGAQQNSFQMDVGIGPSQHYSDDTHARSFAVTIRYDDLGGFSDPDDTSIHAWVDVTTHQTISGLDKPIETNQNGVRLDRVGTTTFTGILHLFLGGSGKEIDTHLDALGFSFSNAKGQWDSNAGQGYLVTYKPAL